MSNENPNPQVILAAALDKLAEEIDLGNFGDVSGCTIILHGDKSKAIITYPIDNQNAIIDRFVEAIAWLTEAEPRH